MLCDTFNWILQLLPHLFQGICTRALYKRTESTRAVSETYQLFFSVEWTIFWITEKRAKCAIHAFLDHLTRAVRELLCTKLVWNFALIAQEIFGELELKIAWYYRRVQTDHHSSDQSAQIKKCFFSCQCTYRSVYPGYFEFIHPNYR